MSVKIVLNKGSAKFQLSQEAVELYRSFTMETGVEWENVMRTDPSLVRVIEILGERAYVVGCRLIVEEIPQELEMHYQIRTNIYGEETVGYSTEKILDNLCYNLPDINLMTIEECQNFIRTIVALNRNN